jgi:hypothetical protein
MTMISTKTIGTLLINSVSVLTLLIIFSTTSNRLFIRNLLKMTARVNLIQSGNRPIKDGQTTRDMVE